ncbi:MAG: glycoside hydrolase family 25 protein [Lachnospiraceae bacterium]|nr:glycoside hydrolase family 25 protein [Lachnospiraceae bacterium]
MTASFSLTGCTNVRVIKGNRSSGDAANATSSAESTSKNNRVVEFLDAIGNLHVITVDQNVKMHPYDKEKFKRKGNTMTYEDDKYKSRLGIDVSHHQGNINWTKVKNAGYKFAFIRIGYRGYGKDGTVNIDSMFEKNIKGAHEAGLDVGVYFFSQAINEKEAKEEAEFIIKIIKNYEIELPVVFDPEEITTDEARTDNVTGEQFTKNTLAFAKKIKSAGFKPMLYSNFMWEAYKYDMKKLNKIDFWYADYQEKPQSPYDFEFWQYTEKGTVPGIEGAVDLNIQMIEK